jgi:hypothetical protein
MKIRHAAKYAAGATAVFAALTDPQFLTRKSEAIKATDISASADPVADGSAVTTLRRKVDLELPGFAKKALGGGGIMIVDKQEWGPPDADGNRTAAASGTMEGHSGGFHGTVSILGDGPDSATVVVEGDVKVSMPLIGGKIEKMVAGLITKMLDSDQRVLTKWLAAS